MNIVIIIIILLPIHNEAVIPCDNPTVAKADTTSNTIEPKPIPFPAIFSAIETPRIAEIK